MHRLLHRGARVALLLALACPPAAALRPPVRAGAPRVDSLGHTPFVLRGQLLSDRFGDALGHADVNGDGHDDLLVGAWAYDGYGGESGRAYCYLGSPAGIDSVPAWTGYSTNPTAYYGWSVAGIGDLDGDGYDEIMVGASRDSSANQVGRALVYRGGPSGPSLAPMWIGHGTALASRYGVSVTGLGDVNGDGHPDVAVGAYNHPSAAGRPGSVFVYYGDGTTLGTTPTRIDGDVHLSWFGYATGRAGDVNADGFDDLVVGATYASHPDTFEGRAYLYLGGPAGIATTPAWVIDGDNPGAGLGYAVGGAGDVNADGYDDVLIGAHHYDTTLVETFEGQGRAFLYYGGPGGLSPTPSWWVTGRNRQAHRGRAVGRAGDVDGDGVDDLLVSDLRYTGTAFSEGRLEVFYGRPGFGPSTLADWAYSPGVTALALGQTMIGDMDLNGDGLVDVAAGTSGPSEDIAQVFGWVYVLYGVPGTLAAPPPWRPAGLDLAPPWPHPVRAGASARVRWALPEPGRSRLALHDAQGRTVAVLADGPASAGVHETRVDAALAPGLYFLSLHSGAARATRRLVVIR